jgi:hypothetical protein
MGKRMLLVAIGCSRLPKIMDIAARNPFVVFGTMDGGAFADLNPSDQSDAAPGLPVYFYETG